MGKGFKHGGSLGGGNVGGIDVIACSSEDELPQTVSRTTIAVITDTPITGSEISPSDTYDGSYFPSEPYQDPYQGRIWVKTGTQDDTSILERISVGNITIFPIVVYQVCSHVVPVVDFEMGAYPGWQAKDAFICGGSSRQRLYTYLYTYGTECASLTGSWIGSEDASGYDKGTFTKNDYDLSIKTTKSTAIYAHTTNAIDLTYVKTIYVDVTSVSGNPFVSVHAEGDTFEAGGRSAYQQFDTTGVVALDVSQLMGKFYVAVGSYGGAYSCTFSQVYMQYGSTHESEEI